MTILTLQRRMRETGRIRIGQSVPTDNGKTRPVQLEKFRLTSADRVAITEAARLYGGEPHVWQGAPVGEVWEVFTEATTLPIVVPPAETVFSQFMETWSRGGCTRRCDGQTELLTDTPCPCLAEDEQTCKPTTRLSVILQELPGLGVWRLESHGWYAATELAGTVEVVISAGIRGRLLPAVLRLEHREVRRADEPVRRFAVPVLDIQVTPTALGLVVGHDPVPAVGAGSWQAIGREPAALEAGQVSAAVRDTVREPAKRRSNSPPELPATGLNPKGAARQVADQTVPQNMMARLQILMKEAGLAERDDRLAYVRSVIGREVVSSKECTRAEVSKLIDALVEPNQEGRA